MKKEIQKSFSFLLKEFKRLQIKQKEEELTEEEKNILDKLRFFLGSNNK